MQRGFARAVDLAHAGRHESARHAVNQVLLALQPGAIGGD